MKWESNYKHPEGMEFIIEYDEMAETYYLYIFNSEGKNTHDYDQDTLEIAKEQALEDFGVPLDSWIETD